MSYEEKVVTSLNIIILLKSQTCYKLKFIVDMVMFSNFTVAFVKVVNSAEPFMTMKPQDLKNFHFTKDKSFEF